MLSDNAMQLLTGIGATSEHIAFMQTHGELVSMDEGFIWLYDKGDEYRLMCESVNRPWSLGFVKKLYKIQRSCDKTVYVESDDPTTIALCVKAGAEQLNDKRAIWRK